MQIGLKMVEHYWNFWIGGIWIAAICITLPLFTGKFLGITKGYASLCSIFSKKAYFKRPEFGTAFGDRTLFITGVLIGGFIASLRHGGFDPTFAYGTFDVIFGPSLWVKIPVLMLGGALWGFGARLANGCTSGNSISGLAKGSLASLITTCGFMAAGIAITHIINYIGGTL